MILPGAVLCFDLFFPGENDDDGDGTAFLGKEEKMIDNTEHQRAGSFLFPLIGPGLRIDIALFFAQDAY